MKPKKIWIAFLRLKRQLLFRNLPVNIKLYSGFCFVFIVMIFLAFIIFTQFKSDKESNTIDTIDKMNIQTQKRIDECINDLINTTKLPLIRDAQGHYNQIFESLEHSNTSGEYDFNSSKELDYEASRLLLIRPNIHSVFVFNLNGQSRYALQSGEVMSTQSFNPSKIDWFTKSMEYNGYPVIISTFELPNITFKAEKTYVFSASREILKIEDNRKAVGVILVNCNIDFIKAQVKDMLVYPHQRILIVDSQEKTVYDTDTKNITAKVDTELLKEFNKSNGFSGNFIFNNNIRYLMSSNTSEITNWKLINLIPYNELNKNIYQMAFSTALITLVLIFISLLFVLLISRQIVRPLKKLVILMKLAEKGDFDVKIKLNNHDEVGMLAKTFNKMTGKIKKLINEVYIEKIIQKDLELTTLKNQINPHFLYNTLESIRMVAEAKNVEEVSEMTFLLGKILRYGISIKKEIVTVREEIEQIQDYIRLQEIRFGDIFNISLNVDEFIYEMSIIKLILQPILENAIYHGISNKAKDGRIDILGYTKEAKIIFEIMDNGQGMDSTKTKRLNDYINGLDNSFKSIGLKNVNKRIKLIYGDDYGIVVESVFDVGTRVIVTVPFN